jgi:site-specific DNA-adenine methylase
MEKPFKTYYGGKGADGTYQALINEIPPHDTLIIPFAGNCAVTRMIIPAAKTFLNDIDPTVYHRWKKLLLPRFYFLYNLDFREFFSVLIDSNIFADKKTYIYCDPPYMKVTRRSDKDIYNYEISEKDHVELLQLVKSFKCKVAISAYQNELYEQLLKKWRKVLYKNNTRHGVVIETLYCNYEIENGQLHDYSYLGKNYTDRQRIKRKIFNWTNRLKRLEPKESAAIVKSIYESINNKT